VLLQRKYADYVSFCQHYVNITINDVVTEKNNNFVAVKDNDIPLALLREYIRVISVRHFALKFQVVAQKTAKTLGDTCRTL